MRRCSFSSSVLARFRGGRVVLGSGSSCPQDFLFFAGLLVTIIGGGEACVDVPQLSNDEGEGDEPLWRSSIFKYWGGELAESMMLLWSNWWVGEANWGK
jgi:hypothetical protein